MEPCSLGIQINYLADAVLWEVPAGSENFPWYMINDAAVILDSYSKVVTIFDLATSLH